MVSSGHGIKITLLRKLLKDKNSGVFMKHSKKHIALNPSALIDTKSAITGHLKELFSKYDSGLGGIVLGHSKVKCCTSHGTILDDYPHIHIDVEADFFIFQPEVGSILSGIVKKKNNDCISCLVHDTFNVTIPITESINLDEINYEKELLFTVEHVDFSDSLPYIRGKLLEPMVNLESVSAADTGSNPKGVKGKKEKKRKKKQEAQNSSVDNEEGKLNEEFNFSDDEFSGSINIDYYCSDDKEQPTTQRKNVGLKTPTSILKKGNLTSEDTPLKRISFYGDQTDKFPNIDSEEKIEANDTSPKKKKKKKKDSGMLEDNDVMISVGDQAGTFPNIDNEENIEASDTSPKKKKKKKKDSCMLEDVTVSLSDQADTLPNIYNENIEAYDTSTKKKKKKKKDSGVLEDSNVMVSLSSDNKEHVVENIDSCIFSGSKEKKRKKKEKDSSSELPRCSSDVAMEDEELFSHGSNDLSDLKETKDKKSKKKKGHNDSFLELSKYPEEVLEDKLFSESSNPRMDTKEKKTRKKKQEGNYHDASDIMHQNNEDSATLVRKRKRSSPSKELGTNDVLDFGVKKQKTGRKKSLMGDVSFEAETVEYNLPYSKNMEGDVNMSESRENSPKNKKRKIKGVSDNEIETAPDLSLENFSKANINKDETSEDLKDETMCVDSGNNLHSEEKGHKFQHHGKKKKKKKNSMEEDNKSTKIVECVLTEQEDSFPSVFSKKFPNASSTATTPVLKRMKCREGNSSRESSPGLPSPISKSDDEMKALDELGFVTSTQMVNNPSEETFSNFTTPQTKTLGKANKSNTTISPKSKNEMQTSFSSGNKSSFFNRLSLEENIQNVSPSKSIKRLEDPSSELTLDGPSNIFHKEMVPTTSKASSKSTSELKSDKSDIKTKKKKDVLGNKASNSAHEDKLKLRNSIVEKLLEAESSALNASAPKKGSKRTKKSTNGDTNASDRSDSLQKQGKSIGSRKGRAEKKNDVNSKSSIGTKGPSNETPVAISLLAAKLLENLG